MRIKDGFILRKVADNFIVVAVGSEALDFNGIITINETGAFLWQKLSQETNKEELLTALTSEYDVDRNVAESDIEIFIKKLEDADLLV